METTTYPSADLCPLVHLMAEKLLAQTGHATRSVAEVDEDIHRWLAAHDETEARLPALLEAARQFIEAEIHRG